MTLAPGNQRITASWYAPPNDGGAPVTGYDVQYRLSTDSSWTSGGEDITALTATITGLTNGMEYQVQVRAQNSVGEGGWSEQLRATPVPEALGTPAVSLSPGDGQIVASWPEPATNGAAISGYDVRYKLSSESSWDDWAHSGTGREATITGLTNGMEYDVQVRARNSVGEGGWSEQLRATPVPEALGTPAVSLSPGDGQLVA